MLLALRSLAQNGDDTTGSAEHGGTLGAQLAHDDGKAPELFGMLLHLKGTRRGETGGGTTVPVTMLSSQPADAFPLLFCFGKFAWSVPWCIGIKRRLQPGASFRLQFAF